MEQPLVGKVLNAGASELNVKNNVKDSPSALRRKSLAKTNKSSPKKNFSSVELRKMKDVSVRMVRSGLPGSAGKGRGASKSPEKKHKTILNSMRKSPVKMKKAMEKNDEEGESKDNTMNVNVRSTRGKATPNTRTKKSKEVSETESSPCRIPSVLISPSEDDSESKPKKQRSARKKDKSLIDDRSDGKTGEPKPKLKPQQAALDTSKGRARTSSKSPSPSRKKKTVSGQSGGLTVPETGPGLTAGKSGKRSRSPNAKFKEDMIMFPWDSEKKSPKKSPKPKSCPSKSGSSSKTSSPSKKQLESEDSFTSSTSSSSSSVASSSDTTPEKGVSPHTNASAIKKLFPADENDSELLKAEENDSLESDKPAFEGLENCSITVDDRTLGMLKNMKYKYSLSKESAAPKSGLSDLIARVNSTIENPDHERNAIFGTMETPDLSEEVGSPGGDEDINDSMDSDKTVVEFDGTQDSNPSCPAEKLVSDDNQEKEDGKTSEDGSKTDESIDESVKSENDEEDEVEVRKESDNKSGVELTRENKVVDTEPENKDREGMKVESQVEGGEDDLEESDSPTEQVSIFEHFGLKLRKKSETNEKNKTDETEKESDKIKSESKQVDVDDNTETDDVICLSDHVVTDVVVISDEDSVTNSPVKKKKFPSVNHIVEPAPIHILTNLEKQVKDKRVAFLSEELEEYIDVNKENMGPLFRNMDDKQESEPSPNNKTSPGSKDWKGSPDIDDVNGFMFVSFSAEDVLKAHVELEQKVDWLDEGTLKKISQLKVIKERQLDTGKARVTDVKSVDEQKQNFRGIHMRYTKYQKLLKHEYDVLMGNVCSTPEITAHSPEKTSDVTKIKGWKSKFKTEDEDFETESPNQMEPRKLLKSDERVLRNMKTECLKEIEMKKKRRKKCEDFDYHVDDDAITEKDVYNEAEDRPPPEKIPYSERYLSQFKYGARKLFVKKMRLDATDEMILKKLGAQKIIEKETPPPRPTKGRQLVFSKITQMLAVAAVSAIDMKMLNKSKKMDQTPRKTRSKRGLSDELDGMVAASEAPLDIKSEFPAEEGILDIGRDTGNVTVKSEPRDKERLLNRERRDKERKKSYEKCDQPGCRYGCICHLCKFSDSGEEKESEIKPPCDKEYCKLGCICDSIDTKQIKQPECHCRKPACMFECKCPPKQPKPDIPKVRGKKKKRIRGMRKRSLSDKMEMDEDFDIKEDMEPALRDDKEEEDWEPPSKKKRRGGSGNRFANLPKRESTYRLAKNLDAVSRKAMIVYESSEMYTEQRIRRRRSDPTGDYVTDEMLGEMAGTSYQNPRVLIKMEDKKGPSQKLNPETGVLEISDDSDVEEGIESCARLMTYNGDYNRKRNLKQKARTPANITPSTSTVEFLAVPAAKNDVIDLADSDTEDKVNEKGDQTRKAVSRLTVSERLGINRKRESLTDASKWKTQMVCLKAKKKSDDNTSDPQSEIKLLEIISNCTWEKDRTNMLSKISQIISKEYSANYVTMWQSYVLQFLPKADKPAVIPPELQSKLPNSMYSIRVRVTQNITDIEKAENDIKDTEKEESEEVMKSMSEEERKKYCVKQQSKLIEKIKFAERLRDLIKTEELKGISPSKFSVSLEGIEKALKRYKTQLWKAYTGSSNKSLMQIKQAVQALKHPGAGGHGASINPSRSNFGGKLCTKSDGNLVMPSGCGVSSGTLSRLTTNQGFKIQNSVPLDAGFISLASFTKDGGAGVSNITINHNNRPNNKKPATSGKIRPNIPIACKPPQAIAVSKPSMPTLSQPMTTLVSMPTTTTAINKAPTTVVNNGVNKAPTTVVNNGVNKAPTTGVSKTPTNVTLISSHSALPVTAPPPLLKMQAPPGVTSSGLNKKANEVLLIPIPDANGCKWDPSANPVFSAKVTMIPTDGVTTSMNNSIVNLTPVPSPSGLVHQGLPVHMVIPSRCPNSNKLTKPMLNPALTAYANAPYLPNQNRVRSPVGGNSQILFSSIQPLSSGSPVFSQVQSMMTQQMGFVPGVQVKPAQPPVQRMGFVPGVQVKPAQPPVGICRPQLPNSSLSIPSIVPCTTSANNKRDIPCSSSGQSDSFNAFPPIRYAGSFVNSSQGPVPLMTSPCNTNNKQVIFVPMPSTSDGVGGVQSTGPVQTMIAVSGTTSCLVSTSNPGMMVGKVGDPVPNNPPVLSVVQQSGPDSLLSLDGGPNNDLSSQRNPSVNSADDTQNSLINSETLELNTGDGTSDMAGNSVSVHDLGESMLNTNSMNSVHDVGAKLEMDTLDLGELDGEKSVGNKDAVDLLEVVILDELNTSSRKRKGANLQGAKTCKASRREAAFKHGANRIAVNRDSEDSDVDIVSVEVPKMSRRKSQQVSMVMDDFEIKSVKVSSAKPASRSLLVTSIQDRVKNERNRRIMVKHYRNMLARVTFKYNPDIRDFSTAIPQHLVLTEATKLAQALNLKAALLQESLDDGVQYQQSLKKKLEEQISEFVQSGVPEPIIRNFTKSVYKATSSTFPKQKKRRKRSVTEEDADTDLLYDRLSTEDVMKNKNTSLERVLNAFGEDVFDRRASNQPSPETVVESSVLGSLHSPGSVYIDHAESDGIGVGDSIVEGQSEAGDSVTVGDVDCGSDVEIRSSTGDVILESDLMAMDVGGGDCSTLYNIAGGDCSTSINIAGGDCSTLNNIAGGDYSTLNNIAGGDCSTSINIEGGDCSTSNKIVGGDCSTSNNIEGGDYSTLNNIAGGDCSTSINIEGGDCSTLNNIEGGDCSTLNNIAGGDCSTLNNIAGGDCSTSINIAGGDCSTSNKIVGGDCSTSNKIVGGDCSTSNNIEGGDFSTLNNIEGGDCSTLNNIAGGDCSTSDVDCATTNDKVGGVCSSKDVVVMDCSISNDIVNRGTDKNS